VVGKSRRFYCLFGDAMNTAARLCAKATPGGGVLVSAKTLSVLERSSITLQQTSVPVPGGEEGGKASGGGGGQVWVGTGSHFTTRELPPPAVPPSEQAVGEAKQGSGREVARALDSPCAPPPSPPHAQEPAGGGGGSGSGGDGDGGGSGDGGRASSDSSGRLLAAGFGFRGSFCGTLALGSGTLCFTVEGGGEKFLKGKGKTVVAVVKVTGYQGRNGLLQVGVQGGSNKATAAAAAQDPAHLEVWASASSGWSTRMHDLSVMC